MIGRFLAACGWLVWRTTGGRARIALALALLLAVAGAAPLVIAALEPQPAQLIVEELPGATAVVDDGWIRLRGRLQPLGESPTGERGDWGLLIDAENALRAVAVRGPATREATGTTTVTGHLRAAKVEVTEELPIAATVAGTPPEIAGAWFVELDPAPWPERVVPWPIPLAAWPIAVTLALGAAIGYPVFRPSREIDVLAMPIAPGEHIPVAVAGRVGEHRHGLDEPAEATVVSRPGPRGGVLVVQLLAADERLAPPPVQIGGAWTAGRIGYVYTVDETLPALAVRSERADAILIFARVGERDRAAALVTVER